VTLHSLNRVFVYLSVISLPQRTVILANTFVDFVQARKSAAMLKSLSSLAPPKALVLRDGGAVEVSARDLVRGDVILLTAGDKVRLLT
jgi:P-type Ca2+ transporter type 2C